MSLHSGVLEAEYKVDHLCLVHIRSKLNLVLLIEHKLLSSTIPAHVLFQIQIPSLVITTPKVSHLPGKPMFFSFGDGSSYF